MDLCRNGPEGRGREEGRGEEGVVEGGGGREKGVGGGKEEMKLKMAYTRIWPCD